MNDVTVSVIIPCYNCADTLDRCIDSVLAQSLSVDEILLIDDCSKDGTYKMMIDLMSTYPGLIKIYQMTSNSGPASARNVGWNNAKSTYICFLDSDDSWHADKVNFQLNYMIKNPNVDMTSHGSSSSYVDDLSNDNFEVSYVSKLLRTNFIATRSVMMKRVVSLRFRENMRYAEDYFLWLELIFSGYRLAHSKKVLCFSFDVGAGSVNRSGLSGELSKMYDGLIFCYKEFFSRGDIGALMYFYLVNLAYVKYQIRKVRVSWSNYFCVNN